MSQLFSFSYWFTQVPGSPNLGFWRVIFILAVGYVILGVVALLLTRKHKKDNLRRKLWARLAAWGFTVGPVFAVLGFFRFQNTILLSMRFWYLAWGSIALLWLLWILKFGVLDLPKKLKKREAAQSETQYLPHKK